MIHFSRPMVALLASSAACLTPVAAYAFQETPHDYDLPAQDLNTALRKVAVIAEVELIAASADLEGRTAPPLKGRMSGREAIDYLLRETGLEAHFDNGSIIVRERVAGDVNASEANAVIVVTGTHIRGASVASPVITVGRDAIEKTGQSDLGEVVRVIPQNFSGGQNPGVGTGGGLVNANINSSSHLNLRGLGADATLTLLNGHRLPYDGAFGGIDISAIPVAAVERIEIVPDGASAQYGSDAVAGVANVILRRDFDGLATSARLGSATSGGYFQQGADAVAGMVWSTGAVLAAYQFTKNSGVSSRQREFAASLPDGNSLYPAVRQHSVTVSGHQRVSDGVEFSIEALFSDRRSRTLGGFIGAAGLQRQTFSPTARSFSIAPEVKVELGSEWMARASFAYGESDSRYHTLIQPPAAASTLTSGCYCNSALSAELVVDGPIVTLPGGDLRIGIGGGYRSNAMHFTRLRNGSVTSEFDVSRDSHFLFAEANVPLVSPAQQLDFVHRLTLTAAARHENYPGMGKVTTPKLGLVYEPVTELTIKASWGRSFKAPTLFQQYTSYETYLFNASELGGGPVGTVLYTSGGNPDLSPERARSWSAGAEFRPATNLRLWGGYFNVRYRDRVTQPIPGSIAAAFRDPGYATLIDRSPSPELLSDIIDGALLGLTNFSDGPYDPAAVIALVDNRNRNVARQDIEGFDLGAQYGVVIRGNERIDFTGSATYLKSVQQLAAELPRSQLAGTVFNPPHWRGRAGLSWQSPGFTLSGFANYTGKLVDRRFAVVTRLPSSITIDLAAQIAVGAGPERPPLFDLTLVVNNVLNDRPPPIRVTGSSDTPYDSTNYSPIGRFIGVKVSRRW